MNYEPPFNELTEKLKEDLSLKKKITLKELFELLTDKYGEDFSKLVWHKHEKGELNELLSIIINGQNYRDENLLNKLLKDGDDLTFLYIYFGG
ncbi:MAG: hypothetical protein GF317_25050 [Candidatus Lokiarchaeota archaeon]|nr:hypothetical protein [Candidatus Lokiarchaeota archaeon]MBD3202627.1 hypothetical protein [Candidatus Lokiarchaeota archaeon]